MISNHTLPILLDKNVSFSQKEMIEADNPSLAEIDIIYPEGTAKSLIKSCFIQLNRLLSLKDESKIDGYQADYFSTLLMGNCNMLSINELGDLFNKIISGFYGPFFGHIDPMLLIEWCRKYVASRSKIIIENKDLYYTHRDREWKRQNELNYTARGN